MKTILVMATKGGVGKSTCADEIAFSFERTGIPISFYDLDPQGGTCHQTVENPDAEVAIVDTPPGVHNEAPQWIEESDLIVIPTGLTPRDVDPLRRVREVVDAHPGKQVLYVLNKWDRFKLADDFMTWFYQEFAGERYVTIPQSVEVSRCAGYGESVLAGNYGPPSLQFSMKRFVNVVRSMTGFPEERFEVPEMQKKARNQFTL